MIVGDFDICDRKASLQKLYSVTYNHFPKVSHSNRDLSTVTNVHTSVTSASTAILPTVANAHISVTSASSHVINALFASFLPSIISLLSRFSLLLVSRRLYKALLYFTLLYFTLSIKLPSNSSRAYALSKDYFIWQFPIRLIPPLHSTSFEGKALVRTI